MKKDPERRFRVYGRGSVMLLGFAYQSFWLEGHPKPQRYEAEPERRCLRMYALLCCCWLVLVQLSGLERGFIWPKGGMGFVWQNRVCGLGAKIL